MISDADLYSLAIFLGSVAMLLIILYHFLEVNAEDTPSTPIPSLKAGGKKTEQIPASHGGGKGGVKS
ncbi:MAG: hypothetical protein M1836_007544 [Candelina mexicana]|nr:MAG: hypothetical protein M1836_007544 [Candelina mexicana]